MDIRVGDIGETRGEKGAGLLGRGGPKEELMRRRPERRASTIRKPAEVGMNRRGRGMKKKRKGGG